jgi:hypothetical protein
MFKIALPEKRLKAIFHIKYRELRFEQAYRTAKSNSNGVRTILLFQVVLNRKYIGQKFSAKISFKCIEINLSSFSDAQN